MRSFAIPSAAIVVLASSVAGGVFGSRVIAGEDRTNQRYKVYTSALAAIERDYAEPMDSAALVYGSIDGMLRTLDPHSSFFSPRDYASLRERQQGHYYGIGITIASIGGDVTVTAMFEGSPAARAGFRRGDVIAMVGTESARGWPTEEVVKRVKGPKGTPVDISIRRQGLDDLIKLTIVRDEIHITTVQTAFMIAPGVGYIRLREFSETSNEEIGAALRKLGGQGMRRLVLDLRDNPGGPLDQAIAVANRFLKRGVKIVYTRGRHPQTTDAEYHAVEEGGYTAQPLVVLVSRQSASASEIVSGAIQDHDRGLVVGETTFGKALVQSVYPISDGAALALTTAHYFTPSGRLIQRPWDSSFDEYLTYTQRDQSGDRPRPASELKYTAGGRKVYGGGGIEPDHFVAGPVEGFAPSAFSRLLVSRGAFVSFATRFAREDDTRPGARSAATHRVAPGWQVTPAMVEEFREFVTTGRLKFDEAAFKADATFIAAMIRYEVDTDLFGSGEARRNLVLTDPQTKTALGYLDEAARLLTLRRGSQ